MKVTPTHIRGLLIIEPQLFGDSRGYFFESYNQKRYQDHGIDFEFVQDNQSSSVRNVIRGLHFQEGVHAQTRLLSIIRGSVLCAAVDLRKSSHSKEVYTIEISEENKLSLLIPKGVAFGLSVLSDVAEALFKCDNYFNDKAVRGIRYNDPELAIDWKILSSEAIVSARDKSLPLFSEVAPLT